MVLERAARHHGLPATIVRERELYPTLAEAVRQPSAQVRRVLVQVGRPIGAPWGADEKGAAAAAWLALGQRRASESGGVPRVTD
jgi:hypothetical protein